MKKECLGTVVKHNLDSTNQPYTVIDLKNETNLNSRIFVSGSDFKIGDKIRITLDKIGFTQKQQQKEKVIANK